jgi:FkbM family methyltransferase
MSVDAQMSVIDDRRVLPPEEAPVPTLVPPRQPFAPEGHWAVRGIRAVLAGRLPYRVQALVDRLMRAVGRPCRQLRFDAVRVDVRRGSSDEATALRVVGERDYQRPGHEIRPTDTVIDIGANIGCFSVVAGMAANRGRVFAFEPDRDNYELAARNAALNGLSNVVVEHAAVSGTPGTLRLFKGAEFSYHTTTTSRRDHPTGGDEIRAVTLQQIFDRHHIDRCDFLKMNCEGAEYDILYKTPPAYLRRIDRVAIEYHANEDKVRVSRALAAFLVAHGIEIFEFTDFDGLNCGYIRGRRRA